MLANSDIQRLYAQHERSSGASSNLTEPFFGSRSLLSRMKLITLFAVVITLLILARIVYLNTVSSNFLSDQMNVRVMRTVKLSAMRGTIIDRNNNPLAVSTPVASIWADPRDLENLTTEQLKQAAIILGMSENELNQKLNQKDKTFVYLKRAVTPKQAEQIKALGIAGIYSLQEYKRFYPSSDVAAHVVGFTNIDDRGSEGIEYADDNNLVGVDGSKQIMRDRQGHVVENVGNVADALNGKTVALSIDNRLQYIAYDALKNQVAKFNAKGGAAVILDAKTGEVLAMVNMPTYNPNNRAGVTLDAIRNRAAIDIYEPGSIIKPLLIAKALDSKIVTPDTVFKTSPYYVGNKLIRDTHDHPSLTVAQIIQKSSDVGSSKIGLKIPSQDLWNYYNQIGFGQKVGTQFPGEAKGILRPWQKWRPLDQAEMSFGYAISVSLMQMARAYSVFTNNGCMLPASFYKIDHDQSAQITQPSQATNCTQIISPATATEMRQILADVVASDGGTGTNARVDGYSTAGKTGTAHIATGHGYAANSYYGSFVGYAPANNPRLIVAVTIDDPKKGGYYGGTVAAPVFSQIVSQALPTLGVAPDLPIKVSKLKR
jgi:cell division protein FtsI (penicillin-binding protein 3)